ncbi:hypothetical protein D9M71_399890 [compost metagenome]
MISERSLARSSTIGLAGISASGCLAGTLDVGSVRDISPSLDTPQPAIASNRPMAKPWAAGRRKWMGSDMMVASRVMILSPAETDDRGKAG